MSEIYVRRGPSFGLAEDWYYKTGDGRVWNSDGTPVMESGKQVCVADFGREGEPSVVIVGKGKNMEKSKAETLTLTDLGASIQGSSETLGAATGLNLAGNIVRDAAEDEAGMGHKRRAEVLFDVAKEITAMEAERRKEFGQVGHAERDGAMAELARRDSNEGHWIRTTTMDDYIAENESLRRQLERAKMALENQDMRLRLATEHMGVQRTRIAALEMENDVLRRQNTRCRIFLRELANRCNGISEIMDGERDALRERRTNLDRSNATPEEFEDAQAGFGPGAVNSPETKQGRMRGG